MKPGEVLVWLQTKHSSHQHCWPSTTVMHHIFWQHQESMSGACWLSHHTRLSLSCSTAPVTPFRDRVRARVTSLGSSMQIILALHTGLPSPFSCCLQDSLIEVKQEPVGVTLEVRLDGVAAMRPMPQSHQHLVVLSPGHILVTRRGCLQQKRISGQDDIHSGACCQSAADTSSHA